MQQEIEQLNKRVEYLEGVLSKIVFSDRYVFNKNIQLLNGASFILNRNQNGWENTQIGTAPDQRVSFYGVDGTPQQSAIAVVNTATVTGSGADATINANFTDVEAKVNDLINTLKLIGITA